LIVDLGYELHCDDLGWFWHFLLQGCMALLCYVILAWAVTQSIMFDQATFYVQASARQMCAD
jgi:hypothetical protein